MRNETIIFNTSSEAATAELGEALGRRIEGGVCICLAGSLGVGKSVFVRGLCRGLGVDEDVLSPTFILFEEYDGRFPVIHLDLYRLEHESDIEEIGVFDRIGDGSVVVVEWGDRSEHIFDVSDIVLTLEIAGETDRRISVSCDSDHVYLFEGVQP
jgi:tRNA threonylcarbamoyladenosine biosynthesis protein TsaE